MAVSPESIVIPSIDTIRDIESVKTWLRDFTTRLIYFITQLRLDALAGEITGTISFGDPTVDGSWRLTISGSDLIFQKLVAGVWTTYESWTERF